MKTRTQHAGASKKSTKFDYEKMKSAALHQDPKVRKAAFIEYFDQFAEFPSYLFDNEHSLDGRLKDTVDDLLNDASVSRDLKKGIAVLLARLPA